MIPIYRTTKMEDTARLLASRFASVMVRYHVILANPIRFRSKLVADLNPYIGKQPVEFDTQIKEWQTKGGTIIYMRNYKQSESYPHDAQFVVECPLSEATLHDQTQYVRDLAVVFKPPTWRAHEEGTFDRFPTGAKCKRLMTEIEGGEPIPMICAALGLPVDATLVPDDAIKKSMELTTIQFMQLRRATMWPRDFNNVQQFIPRIEPEDEYLMPTYRFICEQPLVNGKRLVMDKALAKASRYWKRDLRALVRSGALQKKETLGVYFLDGIAPDYEKIQAEHLAAQFRLARVIKLIEEAKEYK